MKYQILEHTADLAIKGYGHDLAELFSNLAEGMYAVITASSKFKIQNSKLLNKEQIKVEGNSAEELLVNWLNELLFLTATKHQIYYDFQFNTISQRELNTIAEVIPLTQATVEIKAATWHNLKIEKVAGQLQASVVFDI